MLAISRRALAHACAIPVIVLASIAAAQAQPTSTQPTFSAETARAPALTDTLHAKQPLASCRNPSGRWIQGKSGES
jgi:hypothetical protein